MLALVHEPELALNYLRRVGRDLGCTCFRTGHVQLFRVFLERFNSGAFSSGAAGVPDKLGLFHDVDRCLGCPLFVAELWAGFF